MLMVLNLLLVGWEGEGRKEDDDETGSGNSRGCGGEGVVGKEGVDEITAGRGG